MSTDPEFIVKFIAETSKKGILALDAAKKEIEEIDEKLCEAERLKVRRMKLTSVLDHFGDTTYRRRRSIEIPASDDSEIPSEVLEFAEKIKSIPVDKFPLTVRDLILEIGSYDEDALIMRAVKWLGEQEIVERNDEKKIKPGRNWDNEGNLC
jgi:hypothetical protein